MKSSNDIFKKRRAFALLALLFVPVVFLVCAFAAPACASEIDSASKLTALMDAGDAAAFETIVSGLSSSEEAEAYLEGLSDEQARYVSIDVDFGAGTTPTYAVTIYAEPVWASLDELAAEPMLTEDVTLQTTLESAWENLNTTITVASYQISTSNLARVYYEALAEAPEQFNARTAFGYSFYNGIVTQILPSYITTSKTEYASMRSTYESKVKSALSKLSVCTTDLAKVYLLHDWVCDNVAYNYGAVNNADGHKTSFTSYGAMVEGSAVCQGYSFALSDLLNRAGVECKILLVYTSNHAWNMVKFGGNWYHVDATFDDQDICISRSWFMKSDTAIKAGDTDTTHQNWSDNQNYGWTSDMVAGDTQYDNYGWGSYEPQGSPKHEFSEWAGSEATCTVAGIKTRTCSVCGYKETKTTAALGHNWSAWTVVKQVTSKAAGYKQRTCKRSSCGKTETQTISPVAMYRVYNPNSGEHFYTANAAEKNNLVSLGWKDEGIGWTAPSLSNTPVYRLYNQYGGEHHYTKNAGERDALVKAGWTYECIGWYSDDAKGVPLYQEYNPNQYANNHNYTANKGEHTTLISLGWRDEGIAWYGVR